MSTPIKNFQKLSVKATTFSDYLYTKLGKLLPNLLWQYKHLKVLSIVQFSQFNYTNSKDNSHDKVELN